MKAITAIPFAVAFFCLAGGSVWSQELIRIDPRYYCAAEPGDVPESLHGFPPSRGAEEAVREIVDLVGLGTSGWRLWASSQDKASASMDPVSGARRIVYNEDFIRNLRGESASVWANVAILAHEVAHHLNNHLQTGDSDTRQIEELQADRFAGYVLFHKGASEEATQRVFRALRGGGIYPPVRDRVAAARNGWLRASGLGRVADLDTVLEDAAVAADIAAVAADIAAVDVLDQLPVRPMVSGLNLLADYSPSVLHAGGRQPGPGWLFRLQGRLEYRRPAEVYIGIHFWFPDGRMLFANPQETYYRFLPTNQVATGSARAPFGGGELDLSNLRIDALPDGVLNLGPRRYLNYTIMARASVYVDGVVVATSAPLPILLTW